MQLRLRMGVNQHGFERLSEPAMHVYLGVVARYSYLT